MKPASATVNTRRRPFAKSFSNPNPAEQAKCSHTFERQPYSDPEDGKKLCIKCGLLTEVSR